MSPLDRHQTTLEPTPERPATPTIDSLREHHIIFMGSEEAAVAMVDRLKKAPHEALSPYEQAFLKQLEGMP